MQYSDGTIVRLGDTVKLGTANGIVVFIIDTGEFSPAYPEASWGYLRQGLMIETDRFGLVHHITPEEDLVFLARAPTDHAS